MSATGCLQITLNAKKSNHVIFHPYQRKIQSVINLKLFGNEHKTSRNLDRKQFIKYLGVLIDSNLSKYMSKTIGIIARLRCVLPTSVLLDIYNFLNHPYLSYGLVGWGKQKQILKKS